MSLYTARFWCCFSIIPSILELEKKTSKCQFLANQDTDLLYNDRNIIIVFVVVKVGFSGLSESLLIYTTKKRREELFTYIENLSHNGFFWNSK